MKKKILITVVSAMVMTAILSGCTTAKGTDSNAAATAEEALEAVVNDSNESASEDKNDADSSTEEASKEDTKEVSEDKTGYDSTELMEGQALTEDELSSIQDFLCQRDNAGFTMSSYRTPDKVNWSLALYGGAGIANCDYSQEDLDAYLKASDFDSVEYDLVALSGDDVRAFVEKKTGIKDFDVSQVDSYIYIEKSDVLFAQVSDTIGSDVTCYEGVKKDNLVQVIVSVDMEENKRRITLEETADSANPYLFCSNRELWEESIEKTIDAKDYKTGETVTCGIKHGNKGVDIAVIDGSTVITYVHPRARKMDITKYNDVKEIAFDDVNSDGLNDMIVILTDGKESIAVLCDGVEGEEGFGYSIGVASVTEWLSANVKDLTADNVINYIKEHQDELKSI